MNINKTNYESFFLLYIDKELSASAEAAVEIFVRENPNYAIELAGLQKAKLSPEIIAEKIIFNNKTLLYRLPELEASLPQDFKNKLYKTAATNQPTNFNFKTKAALISIAAIFIVFFSYHFNQSTALVSLPKPSSQLDKSNPIAKSKFPKPVKSNSGKSIKFFNAQAKREVKNLKNRVNPAKESDTLLVKLNSNVPINHTTSIGTNPISILNIVQEDQNNSSIIYKSAVIQSEMITHEPLVDAAINTEAKQYRELEIDESDRSLYIANFEIDGTAFRGLSRKFNALLKRNRLAN